MGPVLTPRPRSVRCLLCRGDADVNVENKKLKSRCALSICTIFGLSEKHPFKFIYENGHYCKECFNEIKEADVNLGKLEILKQSLLRFQDQVYSKLGDNYFQIENRDEFQTSYKEFEMGGEVVRGKKFSYDEIIKIIYEKLDQECLQWERFSSEILLDGNENENAKANSSEKENSDKTDASTQTNNDIIIVETISDINITGTEIDMAKAAGQTMILSNVNVDDQHDSGSWNFDAGNDDDDTMVNSNPDSSDPLEPSAPTLTFTTSDMDFGPTNIVISTISTPELSFTQAPTDFEKTISCTFDPENCKRVFYDEYNLKVHIKSFHEGNPRPHECTNCGKSFTEENRLKTHFLRVHSSGGNYMCEHCGKGFSWPALLRDHVRKMHTNKPSEIHSCPFCMATFTSTKILQDHEALHRTKKSPFDCVYCDEALPNSTAAKEHYLSNHSDTKFRCEQCLKVLTTAASLKSHMKLHSDKFKCEECPYVGSSQSGLRNHMQSHSSEKPHTCEVCGTAYKYQKNLTAHMRMHTGEKPYLCNVCGASFREHSYLRRHEESHASECLYKCEENDCGKRFKTKESLKKHKRHVHLGIKKKRKPRVRKPSDADSPVRTRKKKAKLSPVKIETELDEVRLHRKDHKKSILKRKAHKDRSPSRRKVKRRKIRGIKFGTTPTKREAKCEDDIETQKIEEEDFEEVASAGSENDVQEVTQHELNSAVASIEVPTSSSLFSNATVMYANQYDMNQPGRFEIVPIATPVTVVSTQGVNIVSASGERVQVPQIQYRVEYKYN